MFEVTRDHQVVWEWINPFVNHRANGDPAVGIYRAHRYRPDHKAFEGRDLDPDAYANLNRLRQRDLGVERYVWRTARDERVRGNPAGNSTRSL